jgi:hypothetical protein
MMNPDDEALPRDPGPVCASLRDAYASAAESRRVNAPGSHPGPVELDRLLDDAQDDQARLAVVDQLLASRHGVETLAHLIAARSSTASADSAGHEDAALPAAPLAFATPASARRTTLASTFKPLLLAASLLMVSGSSWYVFTLPPRSESLRALGTTVELHETPEAQASSAVRLAWKPLRATSRYRVEVLDANDDPVFATETNDTSAVVPAGSLPAGAYRWWVRSKALDGAEIRSRVVKLTLR